MVFNWTYSTICQIPFSPTGFYHMSMKKKFITLKTFHSNIIKPILSWISHTKIHTIPLSNLPHYLSMWLYHICHNFPRAINYLWEKFLFISSIFPLCVCLCHIPNFIQASPSTMWLNLIMKVFGISSKTPLRLNKISSTKSTSIGFAFVV